MLDTSFTTLRPGSTTLLHSSISRTLSESSCGPDDVVDRLLEALGPSGTLLLPLFNFDFAKGVPFDVRTTPSQMGALSESARSWPGAVRTSHPIYSFAAIGPLAQEFGALQNSSAYGPDSPFALLRELDGEIGVIDLTDQDSMTFYHHVEELHAVPYRYHKSFSGDYTDRNGATSASEYTMFVRDIENGVVTSVNRMGERLWERGAYRGERPRVGDGLRVINARRMYDEVSEVIVSGNAREFLYDVEPEPQHAGHA